MLRTRSLVIYLPSLLVALFTLGSCKENTILNANVAPATDNINTTSIELPVRCRTIISDSFITSNSYAGIPIFHGLGTVTDPYFGKTNAGIYFQVVPPSNSFIFPDAATTTYDSAVLILPYSGFTWGDTLSNINQQITVFEVTEPMSKDSVYYSFTTKTVNRAAALGSVIVNMDRLPDTVIVGKTANDTVTTKPAHLRVKLSDGNFTSRITSMTGAQLATPADFVNAFKGFYLEADPRSNGTALPYFYLDGSTDYRRAGVIFYYHTTGDTTTRTISFPFNTSSCAHFNHVSRNFRGSSAETYINSTSTTSDKVLAQNLPGCQVDVFIDGIQSLPKSLINKAELLIIQETVDLSQDEKYSPPYRLYPIGIDANGATYTIADAYPITSTAPLAFIDGVLKDPDGVSSHKHYSINMPRELQAAIKAGKDTLHLHITGTTDFPGAFRLVAGGNNTNTPTDTKIRFNVVYSNLRN